jgi:hypothetical protein
MATTRWPGSEKSTAMAGHSRVQSSFRLAVRNRRPSARQSSTKSERPALVGGDRAPGARQHAAEPALLAAVAADRELLFLVEPVDELVVHLPALATQQLVQPPVAEPASLDSRVRDRTAEQPRPGAQDRSQPRHRGSRRPGQPRGRHKRAAWNDD